MSQSDVVVPPAAAPVTPPVAAPPAAVAPPVAPVVAAPAPVAAPVVAPAASATELPPVPAGAENWLKPRLEQAEGAGLTKGLKKLGVKDLAEAEALLKKARDLEEAAKTELQKAKERGDSLAARAARADDLEKTVKARADVELAALTDAQRAAVAAVAGDDPARTLSTIDALKPTWAAPAPAATTAAAPVVPAPAAPAVAPVLATPPATTSPPPTAPAGSTTSPPDHKAEYKRLKTSNPHAAAAYLNAHSTDIYPRQ